VHATSHARVGGRAEVSVRDRDLLCGVIFHVDGLLLLIPLLACDLGLTLLACDFLMVSIFLVYLSYRTTHTTRAEAEPRHSASVEA